uniref:RNase H type-1 domain-containing protein n=1 Tax=Setaria viridis TaxID=4556 RepID=A0A4U6TNT0_SETVI|nr:hypothetical protein SEVIR_7G031100v2 [Setaria viridis]
MSETQETKPRGWLVAIISSLKHEDLTRMVVTLWAIWKVIHESSFQSPLSTYCFVNNFIADLKMIKTVHAESVRRTQGVPPWWIPPPPGLVKINVDATTSKNSSMAVTTAMVRDVAGNFLGASALVIHGLSDAKIVEAIVCREGLALASDLMVQHFRLG